MRAIVTHGIARAVGPLGTGWCEEDGMKIGSSAGMVAAVIALAAMGCTAEDKNAQDGDEAFAPVGSCDTNPELPIAQGGLRPTAFGNGAPNGIPNGLPNGVPNGRPDVNGYTQGQALDGIELGPMELAGVGLVELLVNANRPYPYDGPRTELVATLPNGATLRGEALVGVGITGILRDGQKTTLRIASFERTSDSDIVYYRLDSGGRNVCGDGGEGVFLLGSWDATGAHHTTRKVGDHTVTVSFACTGGAILKCINWGYAPWKVGSDMHQACTRMTRADYCGDGVSYTKNGTMIDIRDSKNVHADPTEGADFLFEAGWGPNGAVCVQRPRFDARLADGTHVLPSCWSNLPACDAFETAKARGALITNTSRLQSRFICGQ